MPTFFLDTPDILPLPSLQAYTTISVLLLSCSIYYAFQVTNEPDWKLNATLSLGVTLESDSGGPINRTLDLEGLSGALINQANETSFQLGLLLENPYVVRLIDVLCLMLHEPLCIWTLINMAYCCLILVGKFIQHLVFGELRVSEQQHIKDRFWNFVFYKFIFIFGVMNVQFMDEVVLWCSWFSILGFLCLLTQLCKDRFEYLSFSPMTPKWMHLRLLLLLIGILTSSLSLFIVCVLVGLHSGFNTFAFMAAECTLVVVRTLYVMTRYGIHLWDLNHEGIWESRASYTYYSELIFELTTLSIDFCHHLHMLFWGNIILSMASLVILMQLRYLFYEIKRRIKKHKNYLQVIALMEDNFPMASQEELDKNSDDCAICWDRMEVARKLPCGHLFHNACLRSWLEQDTSCPTCRTSLKARTPEPEEDNTGNVNNQGVRTTTGRVFHFDGSRYASWLPSVHVEVTRPTANERITRFSARLVSMSSTSSSNTESSVENARSLPAAQLESMAQQVQEWFPNVPLSVIMDDLRVTRSVEVTMENILDGQLNVSNASSHMSLPSASSSPLSPSTPPTSSQSSSSLSLSSSAPPSLQHVHLSEERMMTTTVKHDTSSRTTVVSPVTAEEGDKDKQLQPALTGEVDKVSESYCDDYSSPPSSLSANNGSLPSSASVSSLTSLQSPSSSSLSSNSVVDKDFFPVTTARVFSGRFSKSPEERVKILSQRRDELLRTAREAYVLKQRQKLTTSSTSTMTPAPPSSSVQQSDRHSQM